MTDTMTISIDEIEAVVAKIEAVTELDDHDQTVLRALVMLAGERVADLADDEVEGFGFGLGSPGIGDVVLSFPGPELTDTAHSGPYLFKNCCTGSHYKTVILHVRKAGGDQLE
jgi:hypothetical protein